MKYRNHWELKQRHKENINRFKFTGENKTDMAEVFFGRRNKAKEDREKEGEKDKILKKYANPFAEEQAAKPQN